MFCKKFVFGAPYARLGKQFMLVSEEWNIPFETLGAALSSFSHSIRILDNVNYMTGQKGKNRTAAKATSITHYSQRQVLTSVKEEHVDTISMYNNSSTSTIQTIKLKRTDI